MHSNSIRGDQLFKTFFANPIFLEYFINSFFDYLSLNVKFEKGFVIPQAYIIEDNKNSKTFFGDILLITNTHNFITLEMYNHFAKEEYNKSYSYATRLFSNQIQKIKTKDYYVNRYQDMHTVYSINLISGNYQNKNNELVNCYVNKNKETNEEIDQNIITYLIRLDKVKSIAYNINEKKFITILRIINAIDIKEVEKYIRKGDEIMESMYQFLKEWNENNAKNGFEEYMGEKLYKAQTRGKLIGKKEGKSLGKVEEKRNIAKKMLAKNTSVEYITEITGLSKKEILAL